jgi:RNA polymerase sigma-70 factor (ECF subfamily)
MGKADGELVQRTRDGDREAFGALVDRYRDMAYGLAYHLAGDFEAARDLPQEAFVQAYVRLGQLREPEKFAGWLRRIVINVHRMQRRRREVPTVALDDEAQPTRESSRPSEIEVVVREALGKLREPERLALTLHYINGYSHAEIGGFLGVRPETVKTRLARARQHLREEVMAMVEDTFEAKRLPEDFTSETVAKALQRGQAALEDYDYDAALAAFGEAVELQPESADAHAGLGSAWMLRHEQVSDPESVARARAEYRKALDEDPRCEDALVGLASLEPGDQRKAYERALSVLPNSAELRYRLAWATHAAGDTEQALDMMTAMLKEDVPAGVRVRIHNNLGCFFHDKLGDPAKGREHFRLAAETAEAATTKRLAFFHWRVHAWVALRDKQWQEALSAALRVLDVAPTDFERRNLHVLLASALANLGHANEAIEHLEEAAKPGAEPPGADRWPWGWRPPAAVPDPLDWARGNVQEFFAPLARDAKFRRIPRNAT